MARVDVNLGPIGGQNVSIGAAVAAAAALIVAAAISAGGGAPTANLWVDTTTSGNTCTRTSGAGATYSTNAACNTFDAAWDAAAAGDVVRVKDGTYGRQFITGDKASTTKIIGESKAGVIITGTATDCRPSFAAGTVFCPDGDNIWVENVTVDANAEDGPSAGSLIAGQNVTYTNVDVLGSWPDMSIGNVYPECVGCDATGFTWNGGTWGDPNPPARGCINDGSSHGEPFWTYFPNITLNGVTFNKQNGLLEDVCGDGNNRHIEFIRLESGSQNLTVSNNRFMPGSDSGSGYLFGSATGVGGLKVIGNYFADNAASTWVQLPNSAAGYLVAYNTFSGNDAAIFGSTTITWVGNLGESAQGCSGTHIKNVWKGSGSCGTDTYVGATSLGVNAATGNIAAGSPAIDAAESPGASDYCTDAATVKSLDFDGDTRPFGSVCDAGADEYTG